MKTDQKTKRPQKQEGKRPPETIEERVHRHISDINSKITDDDIKSVKTELDIRKNAVTPPQNENKTTKKQKRNSRQDKKKIDETGRDKQTTPWDLLSEGYE
jgi:hypothetical protein